MHIGAIVSLTEERQSDEISFGRRYSRNGNGFLRGAARARLEILGSSLLDRTIARLRQFPSVAVRLVPESPASSSLLPARSAKPSNFITAWEEAIARHVQEGASQLLLLRIGSYSDLDYQEFLRFHLQRGGPLTQAYGANGALDAAVVDTKRLRGAETPYRKALSALIHEQERFLYDGYVNPLSQPHDLRRLVEDGLSGSCGLQPAGTEVSPGVWIAAGARVESSVTISGPAFIGAGSRLAEGCSISQCSSIERDCEIDCGTSVQQSSVLQGVYVGVALNLRRCVVSQSKFFHLDRNVAVEIDDDRLIGRTRLGAVSRASALEYGHAE